MNKALYILEYKENLPSGNWDGYEARKIDTKTISVEAESYDEAVEIAIKRLPKERGEVKSYNGWGVGSNITNFKHAFRLKDCLDQQHATYIPNSQEFNIDNSSSSTSVAIARRSIL